MIIGIDPGKTGAIVALDITGIVLWKHVTPVIGKEIDWVTFSNYLRDLHKEGTGVVVYLEHVHAMHGVAAGTTFTFGGCFEGVKALCAALNIPIVLVAPKLWQKTMWQGVPEHRKPPKKLTKKELERKAEGKKVRTPKAIGSVDTKLMSRIAATRLFPNADFRKNNNCEVPHDGIVDAVLIAEYGRRIHCK